MAQLAKQRNLDIWEVSKLIPYIANSYAKTVMPTVDEHTPDIANGRS